MLSYPSLESEGQSRKRAAGEVLEGYLQEVCVEFGGNLIDVYQRLPLLSLLHSIAPFLAA